ncbi:DNA gyrase inhibitor YacG [Pararhodobacter zhoushanensis]|uniref:DNA gyrase inhibitor YacG n=1 Tax=Pararhodobacter zhoushanensis TaxID=2479545 RepID=A0ABT3GX28_9RHOB|nr:DNA gyrase inhibitor YacG [Pararhodobacter zhoushanensis]MCW1932105.1 DNA gyrase inhibitor YacG [Pararhodobacter zhoushanensis]
MSKAATCAHCGKPVVDAYKPFCSKRCADVDLARWLRADYAIPVADELPDEPEE